MSGAGHPHDAFDEVIGQFSFLLFSSALRARHGTKTAGQPQSSHDGHEAPGPARIL